VKFPLQDNIDEHDDKSN